VVDYLQLCAAGGLSDACRLEIAGQFHSRTGAPAPRSTGYWPIIFPASPGKIFVRGCRALELGFDLRPELRAADLPFAIVQSECERNKWSFRSSHRVASLKYRADDHCRRDDTDGYTHLRATSSVDHPSVCGRWSRSIVAGFDDLGETGLLEIRLVSPLFCLKCLERRSGAVRRRIKAE